MLSCWDASSTANGSEDWLACTQALLEEVQRDAEGCSASAGAPQPPGSAAAEGCAQDSGPHQAPPEPEKQAFDAAQWEPVWQDEPGHSVLLPTESLPGTSVAPGAQAPQAQSAAWQEAFTAPADEPAWQLPAAPPTPEQADLEELLGMLLA